MKKDKYLKGQITLFLSMLITIFLSLIATLLYSSVIAGKKALAQNAVDIGIHSTFAEFNKKLLEEYDLFYVDMSQLKKGLSKDAIADELKDMLKAHQESNGIAKTLGYIDLLKLEEPKVQVLKYSLATDNSGKVYRQQVVNYMKATFPEKIANTLIDLTKDANHGENSGFERDYNMSQLDMKELMEKKAQKEKENEQAYNQNRNFISCMKKNIDNDGIRQIKYLSSTSAGGVNPDVIGYMNLIKNGGILKYVRNKKPLSYNKIDLSHSISRRYDKNEGDGIITDLGYDKLTDKLLFNEYLLDHFSNALEIKKNRCMQYEIEYILSGKDADFKNLKSVAHKLLFIREGANYFYLLSDGAKKAQARSLATIISILILQPEAVEAITQAVMITWAFGESMLDLKDLFNGYKVPVIKTAKSFKLKLSNLTNIFAQHYKPCKEPFALDYKGYLRLLLLIQNIDKNTLRSMDMIEFNMKMDEEHKDFRMDACVECIDVDVIYFIGKNFHYKKTYGYIQ